MIAIISDVHGNYPALQKVLEEIDKLNCQQIISLGDVSGYYCMVNECIDELRHRKIINLLGNHDSYLLGYGKCPRSTTVNRCIDFQKSIISTENLEYLKKSPTIYEYASISMRHGGWNDPIDEYIEEFDFNAVKKLPYNIYCSGHSHIQFMQKQEGRIYFNPGSVGQPRDNLPSAAFALIDDNGNIELKRISYCIDKIATQMQKSGFESRIYECLYRGTRIGGNQ